MPENSDNDSRQRDTSELKSFSSPVIDTVRSGDNVWNLPGGQILLPRIFGFCRGVKRALAMLEQACDTHPPGGKKLFLLGEIIHNPWVNDYFSNRGVRMLTQQELVELEKFVGADDLAVIPAFGVPLPLAGRLARIGCQIIDTTCGDVRRLWVWAERAAKQGYGVLIFGRAMHDETVVTKSRLAEAGGKYVVVGNLEQASVLCEMIAGGEGPQSFRRFFTADFSNAETLEPFSRMAQVSQTTMLYGETLKLRRLIGQAFARRYGKDQVEDRLLFEPTVCLATQDRQASAVELCKCGVDLVVVVGGFGSSNTRHLYELARDYAPAVFVEDADAILSAKQLKTFDFESNRPKVLDDWLPACRPLRLGVLAGASSPEIVVGRVLQRLAELL